MTSALVSAFAEELAATLGTLLGQPGTASSGEVVSGDAWIVLVETDVKERGAWKVLVDGLGAQAVTASIMGLDSIVPAPAIADTWREAVSQTLSALALKDVAAGVKFRLVDVSADASAKPHEPNVAFSIACPVLTAPLGVTVCGEIDVTVAARPATPPKSVAEVQEATLVGARPTTAPASAPPDRLDAILDIELPLIVRFGRTELPIKTLAQLGPGSLIDLGRSADDPVDLLVSNRVVARGEVVVVGGNYGVRVLDVVSPRERARSMEA